MGVLSKGTDFSNGDQVTDTNLDNLVDNATFTSSAVDDSTTTISGTGAIIIKDGAVGAANVTATGSTTDRSVSDRFADVVSVKDFGAVGDGVTDDTVAIQAAIDSGALNIYIPSTCGISSPISITSNSIKLTGFGLEGATIKKLSGFSGTEALKIGDGTTGISDVVLSNFWVDGNNQTGDGIVLQKLGIFVGFNIKSTRNNGWGIRRDGLWLSSMTNVFVTGNGVNGISGGGIKDTFTTRETSDLTCTHVNANSNENHQMLWDDALSSADRMVGYAQYGGEYATINTVPNSPIFEAKCGDRSAFFGVRFNTSVDDPEDAIVLGSATSSTTIDDLIFIGCHTQRSHTTLNPYAVVLNNYITNVTFIAHDHSGTDKFLNASSVTSGVVLISNSPTITVTDVTDANNVTRGGSLDSGIVGKDYGSAGTQFLLKCFENGTPIIIQANTSGGTTRTITYPFGTDENEIRFTGVNPSIVGTASAPTNPSNGTLAYSTTTNDVGNGFGAYGRGLYIYDSSVSAWRPMNATKGNNTVNRPASPVDYSMYFDTTLGKPIWYNGSGWVDATGASV